MVLAGRLRWCWQGGCGGAGRGLAAQPGGAVVAQRKINVQRHSLFGEFHLLVLLIHCLLFIKTNSTCLTNQTLCLCVPKT